MNKKTYIIIAVVAVVVAGVAFFALSNSGSSVPSATPVAQTPATTARAQHIVTYSDSGFSPSTLNVPKGATVTFKNGASGGMWVASDPHPLHNGYPTAGGCISSTFDACKNTPPGGSWSFEFDITGSWGYHNHLNAGAKGTIVVGQ